jgi:hypothetical protein
MTTDVRFDLLHAASMRYEGLVRRRYFIFTFAARHPAARASRVGAIDLTLGER